MTTDGRALQGEGRAGGFKRMDPGQRARGCQSVEPVPVESSGRPVCGNGVEWSRGEDWLIIDKPTVAGENNEPVQPLSRYCDSAGGRLPGHISTARTHTTPICLFAGGDSVFDRWRAAAVRRLLFRRSAPQRAMPPPPPPTRWREGFSALQAVYQRHVKGGKWRSIGL